MLLDRLGAEAEEKSQRTSGKDWLSPCSHPALGWLKIKRRAQCEKCRSICAKYSFTCGDCGIVVCLLCKIYVTRQPPTASGEADARGDADGNGESQAGMG
jgi:hypothetical protein